MFPLRWCYVTCKRHLSVSVVAAICATSALTLLLYKWTEPPSRPDCTPLADRANRGSTNGTTVSPHEEKYRERDDLVERVVALPVEVNHNVHIFYYAWYGNVAVDGAWRHWDHQYLPNWRREDKKVYPTGAHEPPGDISSNYYPALGCYSSRDPDVVRTHMQQLRDAGIGTLVLSWYPPGMSDPEGSPPDALLPMLLDMAQAHGLKVALHIEPYRDRSPINLAEQVRYIVLQYGAHPALLRMRRGIRELPVLYVYDSYLVPAGAWHELLAVRGNLSLRGTQFDAVFLALLVDMQHKYEIKKAHFDGHHNLAGLFVLFFFSVS